LKLATTRSSRVVVEPTDGEIHGLVAGRLARDIDERTGGKLGVAVAEERPDELVVAVEHGQVAVAVAVEVATDDVDRIEARLEFVAAALRERKPPPAVAQQHDAAFVQQRHIETVAGSKSAMTRRGYWMASGSMTNSGGSNFPVPRPSSTSPLPHRRRRRCGPAVRIAAEDEAKGDATSATATAVGP
jgi:hypothetical protein